MLAWVFWLHTKTECAFMDLSTNLAQPRVTSLSEPTMLVTDQAANGLLQPVYDACGVF